MTRSARVPMLVALLAFAACGPAVVKKDEAPAKPVAAVKPVHLDLYVMSKCPYAVQLEQKLPEVLGPLGGAVALNLRFIGDVDKEGKLLTMHGPTELLGDLLQICTQDLAPASVLPLLACMNDDPVTIPENFLACATKIGLDGPAVKACAEGDRGRALLLASFQEADQRGVEGSPTLLVNGQSYEGPRTPLALLRVVCGASEGAKPAACEGVPPPKAIPMVVLADKRCLDCPTDVGVTSLKQVIPEMDARVLDYGTPEGKALWDVLHKEGVKYLPVFLFAKELVEAPENAETFEQIEPYLHPIAGYRMLATSSDFDPTAEICDNGVDDDGNGKADCADPACRGKPICRPEQKGRLDVFVMSQCPYALRAEKSMGEVRAAFGDAMDFRVHYIVAADGKRGFQSLHGPDEVAEDLRQLCAAKAYGKDAKWLDYLACRNKDVRSTEWKTCAVGGLDAKVIEKCAKGKEGRGLLAADAKLSKDLGINGSPTWLVNNRWTFHALSAEDIRKGFCERNADAKGCDKTLSGDTGGAVGGCGGN